MHINKPLALRVITHNVRYDTKHPFEGEALWSDRFHELLAQWLCHTRFAPATFLCLQEVLHNQLQDILNGLTGIDSGWRSIGVGREDGYMAGEYSPILYNNRVWKLVSTKTFWLSETPSEPSKGWDAASTRSATVGVFQSRTTGHELVMINTHLDDQGTVAREEGAKLILQEVTGWLTGSTLHGPLPVAVTGDMNSTEDQEAYKMFTNPDSPLRDTRHLCPPELIYGHSTTFTGFDGEGQGEGLKRIDFIFIAEQRESSWVCDGYAVLPNRFNDAANMWSSDHRAVVVDLTLK